MVYSKWQLGLLRVILAFFALTAAILLDTAARQKLAAETLENSDDFLKTTHLPHAESSLGSWSINPAALFDGYSTSLKLLMPEQTPGYGRFRELMTRNLLNLYYRAPGKIYREQGVLPLFEQLFMHQISLRAGPSALREGSAIV